MINLREEIVKLQSFIDETLHSKTSIKLLEAGCGSASILNFDKFKAYIVGIDISQQQLKRNSILNEKILGDIQEYEFQPSVFDAIVCWDVLEHLPRPQKALDNFVKAVKEDGIIILKMPNLLSLKGIVTKFLPHKLHILSYRYFYGRKNAGKDDVGPFKTYLKFSISPAALKKFAANNGLLVSYFDTYDVLDSKWFEGRKTAGAAYKAMKAFAGFISFGKLSDTEFMIVLKKTNGFK